jgi:hypothetical protein
MVQLRSITGIQRLLSRTHCIRFTFVQHMGFFCFFYFVHLVYFIIFLVINFFIVCIFTFTVVPSRFNRSLPTDQQVAQTREPAQTFRRKQNIFVSHSTPNTILQVLQPVAQLRTINTPPVSPHHCYFSVLCIVISDIILMFSS